MSQVIWILVLVVFLFGGTLGVLVMVAIGIRSSDRRLNLYGLPCSHAESASRRLLGVSAVNTSPDENEER